jgi:hypothetical protein
VLHRDLDEPEPALEREVRRARVRAQALRRAADDDADRLAGALGQYRAARAAGDGADALGEDEVAVDRQGEVGGEREQVRGQPREGGAEAGRWQEGELEEGAGDEKDGASLPSVPKVAMAPVPMIPCGW